MVYIVLRTPHNLPHQLNTSMYGDQIIISIESIDIFPRTGYDQQKIQQ